MSIVKSSIVNLYDPIDGTKHFQASVASDRVDLAITDVPLNLIGLRLNKYLKLTPEHCCSFPRKVLSSSLSVESK